MSSSMSYYTNDIWNLYGDPFVREQMVLTGPPWRFVTIFASLVLAMFALRTTMSNRKPIDSRPYRLVYSGLWFGVNGIGFLCGMASTDWGAHSLMCLDRDDLNIKTISIRFLGWVYLMTLLGDLCLILFDVLEKRAFPWSKIFGQFCWFMVVYAGFSFYPTGHFAFTPLAHCFVRLFIYAAEVMENASDELKAQVDCQAAERRNRYILAAMWSSSFLQQLYFFTVTSACGQKSITGLFATYALLAALKKFDQLIRGDSEIKEKSN